MVSLVTNFEQTYKHTHTTEPPKHNSTEPMVLNVVVVGLFKEEDEDFNLICFKYWK